MNAVMSGYIDDFILVYLDNILVYSDNAEEHEAHLQKVFDRLHKHKLQAKLKKCEFDKPYIKYLGHVVGSGELCVDSDKVAAVLDWEPPKDIKGVQQFLGFSNHYNCFIKLSARIAAPISNLLSGLHECVWGNEQQQSFKLLKQKLTTAPVLALPDFSQPFDVTTDASVVAVGGEVLQCG